jgi:hypothetical protein
MSLFDIFRRKPRVTHPVFGSIVYADASTWECGRVHFSPLSKDVEVLITAGPAGPTDDHVCFFRELESRWTTLSLACAPLIRSALGEWIETPEKGDILARVTIESLPVFEKLNPEDEWELQFWCEEASHWPTVVMKGWIPQSCYVDG